MPAIDRAKRALLSIAGEPGAARVYAGDDSAALTAYRLEVLARKQALRRAIADRDAAIRGAFARFAGASSGPVIEIGSGLTPYDEPGTLHTDVYASPAVGCLASALALPFRAGTLRGIVGIHAFHHLPNAGAFFREAARTLEPGGLVVLIEPNFNRFSSTIFGRFHPERFDREAPGWSQALTSDNDANQAFAWVVFFRDSARFDREHPDLEFVATEPLESLSFVLTGGYLLRQLAPAFAIRFARSAAGSGPVLGATAVHRLIVLRRR